MEGRVELVIVRHGETYFNAENRLQGQMDSALNEKGKKQACAIAARLVKDKQLTPSVIISSDLSRAYDTAKSIYEAVAKSSLQHDVLLEKDTRLRERNLGASQGRTMPELEEDGQYEVMQAVRDGSRVPGNGESLEDVFERVVDFFEEASLKYRGQRVAIVAHGGTINEMHRFISGRRYPGRLVNCGIGLVTATPDSSGSVTWNIEFFNDKSHLDSPELFARAVNVDMGREEEEEEEEEKEK